MLDLFRLKKRLVGRCVVLIMTSLNQLLAITFQQASFILSQYSIRKLSNHTAQGFFRIAKDHSGVWLKE